MHTRPHPTLSARAARSAGLAACCCIVTATLSACVMDEEGITPVRASLDDGQVLMGRVRTQSLLLTTGFGTIEVPLADIGEVFPVEGGALSGSGNHISVWLRNGSDLRGEWHDPELSMGIVIDDQTVPVDVPMDQLQRIQCQDGDLLPAGIVYRVRTIYGDDFVVDGEDTHVRLDNDLGSFQPSLAEVASLSIETDSSASSGLARDADTGSTDDAQWHLLLETQTELVGALGGAGADPTALVLALPLGPNEISLPVRDIVSIERQDWGGYDSWSDSVETVRPPRPITASPEEADQRPQAPAERAEWFDNSIQRDFKRSDQAQRSAP